MTDVLNTPPLQKNQNEIFETFSTIFGLFVLLFHKMYLMDLPLARVCKWLIMVVNSFTQAAKSEGSLSHVVCNLMLHGGQKKTNCLN